MFYLCKFYLTQSVPLSPLSEHCFYSSRYRRTIVNIKDFRRIYHVFMQSNPLIDSQIFKLVIAPWIFYWDYFAHACQSSRQTRSVHIFLWFIWRHTVILQNILYLLITIIHFVVLLKYSNPVGPKQNRRIMI